MRLNVRVISAVYPKDLKVAYHSDRLKFLRIDPLRLNLSVISTVLVTRNI